MRALSLVKCPPPKGFFRGQMPCTPGWSDKTQIDFRNPERGFQHCHFYYFCIPVQRLRSSFFFCVHHDHLGSRYELSAFGTLHSSVSRQEEVQRHESVHSKFCNSRVFSRFVTIRLQLLAKKQILRKMYLALFVEILVFLTFLPGLFVAGPRSSCDSRCSPLLLVF